MSQLQVLACTDGSAYAPSVYDHAIWAGRQMDARVHILHLVDHANAPDIHNLSGNLTPDIRQILKEEIVKLEESQARLGQAKAQAVLEAARTHMKAANFANFRAEAKHGRLAESIEEYEAGADLVIIGKRGESADFERLHLGSQVERVIRSCRHPVLVANRAFKKMDRFLIAYDGGPSAKKAVTYLANSPLVKGMECHLLAVGKPHAKIEEDLKATALVLESAGLKTTANYVQQGHPEDVFEDFIKTHDVDCLVMGAYGHSRIRQLIIGSTTTSMVRTCRVPVLMFR